MMRLQVRLFLLLLFVLSATQTAVAIPSEHHDIWRVDLYSVAYLPASEQNFSKLGYYRWENNRWIASDAATFFATQQPEIPLIVFAPGYSVTSLQVTQVGLGIVQNFDRDKPCRVVLWDWYSDRGVGRIRYDLRRKLPIVYNTGVYLTLFLQHLNPQSKACLFGFSFGSRIVCHAAETLRRSDQQPEGLRLNLVLSGAATDQRWFAQGQQHSRIPEIVEKILVTYNSDDWVLRFYPLMYNFGNNFRNKPPALGFKGLPMESIPPKFRAQFKNINVRCYIGKEHQTLPHVQTPVFRSQINTYFFFE